MTSFVKTILSSRLLQHTITSIFIVLVSGIVPTTEIHLILYTQYQSTYKDVALMVISSIYALVNASGVVVYESRSFSSGVT